MGLNNVKPGDPLNSREREVLMLLSNGLIGPEIADVLEISRHTVNDYVKRLHRKLEAETSAQAVAVALRAGVIR